MMKPGSQFIYLDESGSPDVLNSAGKDLLAAGLTSQYLVIAALRTTSPSAVAQAVLRTVSWADGQFGSGIGKSPILELHARDDRPSVRTHMLTELAALDIVCSAIVMDKGLLDPSRPWRADRRRFYNEMMAYLLADCLHLHHTTRIIVSHKNYESQADLQVLVNDIGNRFRAVLTRTGVPPPTLVTAREDRHSRNRGLQAVDYVAWSVFQAFERNRLGSVSTLQPVLRHVWDLGQLTHYSRKNPIGNPP
jgi:hypothetical protein